ncbi:MAG: hypothetical protein ABI438_02865 [Dermatophilaceae bacterium]
MTARLDRHPLVVRDRYPSSADVADVVAQGVRAGFGILSLALGVALRTLGEATAAEERESNPGMTASDVADLLVGSAWGAAQLSGRLAAAGARVAAPVLGLTLRPPLVPQRLQPEYAVQRVIDRWQRDRPETVRALGRWSSTAVPGAVDAALAQVDLQRVVAVALDHANLDALITDIVRRLDLESIAVEVLERVDLARLVSVALEQIDLTQLVLDRVDLERVASSLLRRLDLTAVVVDQVDLGRVVDAALKRVDLTEVVLQQVDLIGVAEYVVAGIDLPEIIRESTGSVASGAVRGLRMQGADADLAVGRAVDRILHRRRHRRTEDAQEHPASADETTDHQRGQQR